MCSIQEAAVDLDKIRTQEKALEDSFDRQGLKDQLIMLFDNAREEDRPLSDTVSSSSDETSDASSSEEILQLDGLLVKLLHSPGSDFRGETMKSWLADEHPDPYLQSDKGQTLNFIYEWAQKTPEYRNFHDWSNESNCRVLWVRGDLGTGKTMLLHGAVPKLLGSDEDQHTLRPSKVAYHFTDTAKFQQGNALSVVKTLISHILKYQPTLSHHLSSKFHVTGRENLDSASDFYAMSTIFYSLIQDPNFCRTYFVLDAIEQFAFDKEGSTDPPVFTDQRSPQDHFDEQGLSDLLSFISTSVKLSDKTKWLLSLDSNRCDARLESLGKEMQLDLIIDSNSKAIRKIVQQYAVSKIAEVATEADYSAAVHQALADKLEEISPDNFMWLDIALDLVVLTASATPWNAPEILEELKGTMNVRSLYIFSEKARTKLRKRDQYYCSRILSVAAVTYRPLLISELVDIVDLPIERNPVIMVDKMLFPFLMISEDRLYFRHQSSRDFIWQEMKK